MGVSTDRTKQCNYLQSKSLKLDKKWNWKSAAKADLPFELCKHTNGFIFRAELLASQIVTSLLTLLLSVLMCFVTLEYSNGATQVWETWSNSKTVTFLFD